VPPAFPHSFYIFVEGLLPPRKYIRY
jgi:hypothetical protein